MFPSPTRCQLMRGQWTVNLHVLQGVNLIGHIFADKQHFAGRKFGMMACFSQLTEPVPVYSIYWKAVAPNNILVMLYAIYNTTMLRMLRIKDWSFIHVNLIVEIDKYDKLATWFTLCAHI